MCYWERLALGDNSSSLAQDPLIPGLAPQFLQPPILCLRKSLTQSFVLTAMLTGPGRLLVNTALTCGHREYTSNDIIALTAILFFFFSLAE